jgi:hypothetical protein
MTNFEFKPCVCLGVEAAGKCTSAPSKQRATWGPYKGCNLCYRRSRRVKVSVPTATQAAQLKQRPTNKDEYCAMGLSNLCEGRRDAACDWPAKCG